MRLATIFRVGCLFGISALLAACAGSSTPITPGGTPLAGEQHRETSSVASTTPQSYYTIYYLPLERGCYSAAEGGLATNGVAAVFESCHTEYGSLIYVYENGKLTDIPYQYINPQAVNDQKVVSVRTRFDCCTYALFNASTQKATTLASNGYVDAMNDSGLAVGDYISPSCGNCATSGEFSTSTGSLTSLNLPGILAFGINANGDVSAQGGEFPTNPGGAYLVKASGQVTNISAALGYKEAYAWGLNDEDHVVVTDGPRTGAPATTVLWKGGTNVVNVPPLPGDVTTWNDYVTDDDHVIGESCNDTTYTCRPFVSYNGTTLTLASLVPGLVPSTSEPDSQYGGSYYMSVSTKGEILIDAMRGNIQVVAALVPKVSRIP